MLWSLNEQWVSAMVMWHSSITFIYPFINPGSKILLSPYDMSLPSSLTFSEELRNRPPHFNSTTVHDEAGSPDTPDLLEDTPGRLSPTVPNLSDYVLPSFLLTSNSPTVPDGSASSLPPPELTFIRGRKGSDQACYNGYIYSKDRNRPNGDIYWQCRDRKIYTPSCFQCCGIQRY